MRAIFREVGQSQWDDTNDENISAVGGLPSAVVFSREPDMKSTQYGEYLIQLTRLGMVNCFLVREEDGFTLVDTNLPGSAKGILQTARQYGASITRIVLTHAHGDHVASLDALRAELPQAEIALSRREARFLAGDMSLDPVEPQARLRGGYLTCQTRPTRQLEAGDRIGSLEVVASPGHTPGHAAFLDVRDRTLIAGDSFVVLGGVAVTGVVHWLFPLPHLATWHPPTARQSARAMRGLNPSRLAVGHGKTLENPLEAMDRAIREADQKFG
ncbi:MAG: MBL fold metallo-hydrolase [Chloroflexota bacterium]